MTRESQAGETSAARPGPHNLLSVVGVIVVMVALLAHLFGGVALSHFGLGAPLANLGPGGPMAGAVAVIAIKLAVGFGARRWFRRQ